MNETEEKLIEELMMKNGEEIRNTREWCSRGKEQLLARLEDKLHVKQ